MYLFLPTASQLIKIEMFLSHTSLVSSAYFNAFLDLGQADLTLRIVFFDCICSEHDKGYTVCFLELLYTELCKTFPRTAIGDF